MSTPARVVVSALAVVFGAAIARRLRIAAGMRRGDQAVIDAKRNRNKRFANKMVRRVGRAGRPHSVFAIMEVTGRRSGRTFTTPVRVVEQQDDFVIPLTYGRTTNWLLNLQHHPGTLHWQGRPIPVGEPVIVASSTVTHLLPPPSRFLLWLDGTDECVRIKKLDHHGQLPHVDASNSAGHPTL